MWLVTLDFQQDKGKAEGGARPKQKVQKSASIATDMDHNTHHAQKQTPIDNGEIKVILEILFFKALW